MEELLRTNDMVLISYVEALLSEDGLAYVVLDQNMSVMEGSVGVLPRRVMVTNDDLAAAKQTLFNAGLGDHVRVKDGGIWP